MKKSHNTFFKRKPFVILSAYVFSGIVITSLLCVQTLQAEPLPPRGPIPFHLYDINSNGFISQDEFNTIRGLRMESKASQGRPMQNMGSEPNFKQFDTDNDGQLSPDELARGQQLQRQKRWEMRQGQGMGMRQAQGGCMGSGRNMPRFEDFDQNKDGLLTPEEFTYGLQQHRQNRQNMRQGQGMGMRQGRGMGGGRNMPEFEDFDGNSDGYISEQELTEARSMRISNRIQQGYPMRNTANITAFQDIDKNSDGKISPEEFSTHQKQHQMRRQRVQ
jgi:Ca2+-binding EF-hand superfamily protein